MWLKVFIIVYLIVLQNTISSQSVIESEKVREQRQTGYEECCPCPGVRDNVNFGDQDVLSSRRNSFLRVPPDECSCRSGLDNEGSSSIFYPSFLRGAKSMDRAQEMKQDPKPLLRPEVGLASSVLETLKEATDEEYKEALLRDATRNAANTAVPVLLDTEPEASKNSVTIVINPQDSDNGYDAVSEASHAHETRCIHSPLRKSNFESSRRVAFPRVSEEYILLPKHKFKQPLHKSLFDMDNSPSNIQESFEVLNRNHLGNKLKMNPSLLSELSSKMNEQRDSWSDSGIQQMMTPEQCDDFNRRTELNSPMFKLTALKNKLRDLSELRNAKRLNNNLQADLLQSKFNVIDTKNNDAVMKLPLLKLPTFDAVLDKQSPFVKNILKLRDVELLPPQKTNINDISKKNDRYADLKAAGSENKADINMASKTVKVNYSDECDAINRSISGEFTSKDSKETEPKSITSDNTSSSILQADSQEDTETIPIDDSSSHVIQSLAGEMEMLNNSDEQDFKNNIKPDFEYEILNIDDEQNEAAAEIIDSEPESTNIMQQENQESGENDYLAAEANESNEDSCYTEKISTISPISLPTNIDENIDSPNLSVTGESSQPISLKDDILRRLENLRNTIKIKFAGTEYENFKDKLALTTSTNKPNEKPITTIELQKISDSLLNEEKSKTKAAIPKDMECVVNDINSDNILSDNQGHETSNFKVNDDKSSFSDLNESDAQLAESGVSSEYQNNLKHNNDDRINTTMNPSIQHDIGNLHNSEHTCGTVSKESYDDADGDISLKDEMFSQASNLKYNALQPQSINNYLRSFLPQDIANEPSILTKEKDSIQNLQIPSLEEIRQSITNIIDAGQQEEEGLGPIDPDPLNESSNMNLVQLSNKNMARKLPKSGLHSLHSVQKNSLLPNLNLNSQKNRLELPDFGSLRSLKSKSMINNRVGNFGNSLSMGADKIKSLSKSKSALDALESSIKKMPTLDKIRDSVITNTQTFFKDVPFQLHQLPLSHTGNQPLNSLRNSFKSYADNSVKPVQSNIKDNMVRNQGIFSTSQTDSDNIFETIARRREDMTEKLQALHVDFNDRLATIHDKLLDQTNLQSVIVPAYKESGNNLNLPIIGNLHNSVSERNANTEPNLLLKPRLSSKQGHQNIQKSLVSKDFQPFYTSKAELLNGNPHLDVKKLPGSHKINKFDALRNNLDKQRGLMPLSNADIKISFTSSTVTPELKRKNPIQKYTKPPLGILKQSNNLDTKNMVHSRLKAISNAYRTKINNNDDSKHSPSEIVPLKINSSGKAFNENNVIKNWLTEPEVNSSLLTNTIPNSKLRLGSEHAITKNVLDAKNMQFAKSVEPLAKDNQFITNIREALRLRLATITPTSISTKDKNDPKPFLDAIESPTESVKTVKVLPNPLKENTSYKCTMRCVRD